MKKVHKIRPPPKQGPSVNFFETVWPILSKAINEIYDKNASLLSFEELYRNAYNLVLRKQGHLLYDAVKELISNHVTELSQTVIAEFIGTGDAVFLKQLNLEWIHHTTCLLMLRDILMYMDRLYVSNANVPMVYDLGLSLFRDSLLFKPLDDSSEAASEQSGKLVKDHLFSAVLSFIEKERNGDTIDRLQIKRTIEILLAIDARGQATPRFSIYQLDFEPLLLSTTRNHYRQWSETFFKENIIPLINTETLTFDANSKDAAAGSCIIPVTEYLKAVEIRFAQEKSRVEGFLSVTFSDKKIVKILDEELLEKRVMDIIEAENAGLLLMLSHPDKCIDAHRVYNLFSRVANGLPELCKYFGAHTKKLGHQVNELWGGLLPNTKGNAVKWVESIIALLDKLDLFLEKSFEKDKTLQTEMNNALQFVVGDEMSSRAPEYISLYIDDNLKKGIKGKSEEEIDALLDKTIVLFRFIREKDVFERYYKQHLTKRLIMGKSSSEDAEKSFIAKLKMECGHQFTRKLEVMFNDMRISSEAMNDYRSSLTIPKFDLNLNILSTLFWPSFNHNKEADVSRIAMPDEILSCVKSFQAFYDKRHNGRKLTWLHHIGTVDLKAIFDKKGGGSVKKEINVSTYGMVVLMKVFNEFPNGEQVLYTKIEQETSIPKPDLDRTLQSLSMGKYKILSKVTNKSKKEILSTDKFALNINFTCNVHKLKIATIISPKDVEVEASDERAALTDKINEDRRHQIDAATVRIMKSRKSMDHNQLVGEIIQQVGHRFQPSVQIVKQTLESLIEREYLKRDEKDRKVYHYVA